MKAEAPHLETDAPRASALAAFRAGRAAMKLEALRELVDMMNDVPLQGEKRLLMDACERIERIGAEEK